MNDLIDPIARIIDYASFLAGATDEKAKAGRARARHKAREIVELLTRANNDNADFELVLKDDGVWLRHVTDVDRLFRLGALEPAREKMVAFLSETDLESGNMR